MVGFVVESDSEQVVFVSDVLASVSDVKFQRVEHRERRFGVMVPHCLYQLHLLHDAVIGTGCYQQNKE